MRRQLQGMDRPGVHQVPEGSGEQGKMEETGCKIICGASTNLAVKGQMRDEIKWREKKEANQTVDDIERKLSSNRSHGTKSALTMFLPERWAR